MQVAGFVSHGVRRLNGDGPGDLAFSGSAVRIARTF
jgi:hypothetical protein